MTKSLTNDSRRGRCLTELSFLKEHGETYLQLESVDDEYAFVIIIKTVIYRKPRVTRKDYCIWKNHVLKKVAIVST